MKLVIDIPEETYNEVCWRGLHLCPRDENNLVKVIENGTPLDKHDEEVIKNTVESIWGKPPYTELLDKIKAEIKNYDNFIICANGQKGIHIDKAFEIIDKYKESEEEDG